jgi:hypothetical protein
MEEEMADKRRLKFEGMESQFALELPERETLQVVVVVRIGNILSGNHITVNAPSVNVATQVCVLVSAINALTDCDSSRPLFCSFE